jgi:uncharacterized circularly permuted ATP-grasp superfamily protein
MLPRNLTGSTNEVLHPDGTVRPIYQRMMASLQQLGIGQLQRRWQEANDQAALDAFTFALEPNQFRPVPTDWLPRFIAQEDWELISAGVAQRQRALNKFLADLYCGQQKLVPEEVVYSSHYYDPEVKNFLPPLGVYAHIYGVDLVRLEDGNYVVLEDNVRIPSGISYQLKCVELGRRFLPELLEGYGLLPYDIRPTYMDMFASLSQRECPTSVILTDGCFGAAFFEHRYLSELLGIPLVEGSDLQVGKDGRVCARTLDGEFEVDVIYRRVEDLELFVPGLHRAYLQNKVVLVNALGTGVVDDKLVFLWVPDMISHYLNEEPILRQATSYHLMSAANRRFVLENMDRLVLKTREGYGGHGVFIMPDMSVDERASLSRKIASNQEAFVAQEMLDFSKHFIFNEGAGEFEERYIDLRVYSVQNGRGEVSVIPGGLTRVSLANTRITNNSSGGFCKGTWIVQ